MIAGLALGLVGQQHHRHFAFAQIAADLFVERGDPGPGVDHEQCHVGPDQRGLGLLAHPPRQARWILVLPPGGVDHGEIEAEQMRVAKAAVARHPRLIVNQRELFADQPVPQGGLADVGTADDDDLWKFGGERHLRACAPGDGFLQVSRQSLPCRLPFRAGGH